MIKPAPSQLAEIETEMLGPRRPAPRSPLQVEDLLREETFDSVARPAHLQMPEEPLEPVPAALSLPEVGPPDAAKEPPGRLAHTMAFLVTIAVHGLLIVALENGESRTPTRALLLPAMARDQPTERLRVVLMDDPGAPPPVKKEKSANASDRDRGARGGELVPGAKGDTPKLRGESSEPIYSPNRGRPGPKEEQASPRPRPTEPPRPEEPTRPQPESESPSLPEPQSAMAAATSPQRPESTPRPLTRPRDLAAQAGMLPSYQSVGDGGLFGFGEVGHTEGDGTGTEGSVSFETSWFDWSDYATAMLRKIKWNWVPPHALYVGIKGHVRVSFVIQRSGEITDVRVERGSGTSSYDEAAVTAIEASSPLAALPADFPFGQERVTINFLYNMRRVAAKGDGSSGGASGG